ncbi:Serine/threonine-protein kinase PknB [Gimesia chilikensis]|uniref:non-specific serine/threonine protein kinase n=1 Tax=Gimesia chilikensis TaxID=2605989 RepID=A0A517WER4_9PLAN|nr:serine/threonine-protein kinase [Gimesia chilikensis]QDU03744.1 Serine/threonine-protein kinase PknB [Gimesia chilikensis]
MSEATPGLESTESQLALDALTEAMEQFVSDWESAEEPPELRAYLSQSQPVPVFLLNELIKIDLEYRWQRFNFPKRLQEYLEEFPELQTASLPVDLLYEEYHLRRQNGFDVDPDEYLSYLPTGSPQLQQLFDLDHAYQTTSLFHKTRPQTWHQFQPGQTVDDFDLLTLLGQGAFARVFQARQNSMQRLVALKISEDSSDEPQTLAQFDHENIVRVFDQRVLPDEKLRLLYMQYLPGGTLQSVIELIRKTAPAERSGSLLVSALNQSLELRGESRPTESVTYQTLNSLSWPETICWIGIRLAKALDYAHQKGVLHRDIKPANVLLTAEGVPKLADFNISFSSHVTGTTPAAYFGGSLAYMSPEQLEAYDPTHTRLPESLDERSDLFSLGLMLAELLTGKRPFENPAMTDSWSSLLSQMIEQRKAGQSLQAAPQHLPPDCPEHLITVLQKCLAPDPAERWSSGQELASQLELCLNPRAQQILFPSSKSWFARCTGCEVLIVILIVAIPNILAGLFNFFHNQKHIIEQLKNSQDAFWNIQTTINLIAYPTGLGLMGWLTWTLVRERAAKRAPAQPAAPPDTMLQKRCLRLGHYAALICTTLWVIAGIAYPVSMHYAIGSLPVSAYLHFLGSLLLCGLIAASYPFFGVTYFSLHTIYPQLIERTDFSQQSPEPLERLKKLSWVYLILAFLVPMLSIAALAILNLDDKLAIVLITVAGTLGAVSIFRVFQSLQADLDALITLYSRNQRGPQSASLSGIN